jgi:hypothetical protein
MPRTKPPNATERAILAIVLTELRRVRKGDQLTIIVDPYVKGAGAYVFASPNTPGRTYEVNPSGPIRAKRKG